MNFYVQFLRLRRRGRACPSGTGCQDPSMVSRSERQRITIIGKPNAREGSGDGRKDWRYGTSGRPAAPRDLRRTGVRLRSTRYDIASHLHSYTPFLSSTPAATERSWSPVPDVLRSTHIIPSSPSRRRYQYEERHEDVNGGNRLDSRMSGSS